MTQPTIQTLNAEALSGRLQQLAQGAGIQQWDLGASCSTDTSVQVDRGEAKQMKGAQRSAITLRVWNGDGLVGITSTSDLSESGLARALSGALIGVIRAVPFPFAAMKRAPSSGCSTTCLTPMV